MISQWENEYILLSVLDRRGPGSIPGGGGVSQGIFPRLITLCEPVLRQLGRKWLNLPSMAPHDLWTSKKTIKVQPWTDNG